MDKLYARQHGGSDAGLPIQYDFSTNSNALGPCPHVLELIQASDCAHYPDPEYHALRHQLAQWHGVDAQRILIAGSASEFIFRFSLACFFEQQSRGIAAHVHLPKHGYGDYAAAAQACGLIPTSLPQQAHLIWACEPSSPLGQTHEHLVQLIETQQQLPTQAIVLDCAYQPLRLSDKPSLNTEQSDQVWQLYSPNKALGLTGIRGAYAIAPNEKTSSTASHNARLKMRLQQLAASWPVGAHAHTMLNAWTQPETQAWLAQSLLSLADWKAQQIQACEHLGWRVLNSNANFFCVFPQDPNSSKKISTYIKNSTSSNYSIQLAQYLRLHGIKVRTTDSFGLAHHFRLGVRAPEAQAALLHAVQLFAVI
jgi:histidinol-phosphate aminotransferase